jgi:hypothetical protein
VPFSRQTQLGILAAVLLMSAAALKIFAPPESPPAIEGFGACLRMGLMLAVFALAYKDLAKLPAWLLPALGLIALAMFRFKWLIMLVPPVIFLAWLLRPRTGMTNRRT